MLCSELDCTKIQFSNCCCITNVCCVSGCHRFQSEIVKEGYSIHSNIEKLGYEALEGAASP